MDRNVIAGITVIPSGTWGLNRAQEHGCTYCAGVDPGPFRVVSYAPMSSSAAARFSQNGCRARPHGASLVAPE